MERLSLEGLLREAGCAGGVHRWSAQGCLEKILAALPYSSKPPESGPAARAELHQVGEIHPWLYFSPSLSMPPLLESWVLERLEMQSPSRSILDHPKEKPCVQRGRAAWRGLWLPCPGPGGCLQVGGLRWLRDLWLALCRKALTGLSALRS